MKSGILALSLVLGGVGAAGADELVINYGNTVKPDAALKAFVGQFQAAIAAKKPDYKKINGMFAPKVKAFSRSLDPLQPWNKSDTLTSKYIDGIIDIIVEQAPLADNAPQPDYRLDALAMMAHMLASGTLGSMKEIPGSVCAPAEWSYDTAKVAAFLKAADDSANSVRFYPDETPLFAKPKKAAKQIGAVPANSLVSPNSPVIEPDGWMKLTSAGGLSGYAHDDDTRTVHYLSQMHVCFGKVSGKYKVTGIFGYGL
jgi:hypothetical protein